MDDYPKYTEAHIIREARLIVACPEYVMAEIKKYADDLKKEGWLVGDERLEKSLLARNEPLIDLGLALYASEAEVVAVLYKKSHAKPADQIQERYLRGLRIACLSNEVVAAIPMRASSEFPKNVLSEKEFERLMTEGENDEIIALLSNSNLADEVLTALYKNEGLFASLSDERRHLLVAGSANNPRLITNEDSELGLDIGHMRIRDAIITMLASAPLTESWLFTLRNLLNHLYLSHLDFHFSDERITSVLERWAKVPVTKDEIENCYYTTLSMKDEFRCLVAAICGDHLGSPNAAEVVLRCAYYGKAKLTVKEMEDGFARDQEVYLLAVLCNNSVYKESLLRELLENELRHRGERKMEYVYRRRCEQIHKRQMELSPQRRPSFDPRPFSNMDDD